MSRLAAACIVALVAATPALAGREGRRAPARVPAHPSRIVFPPLAFEPPSRTACRHELSNGVVVHVVEDRAVSLVDVTVKLRAGTYLDPPGREGLASAVAEGIRQGGAGAFSAEDFDEEVAFLAATLDASADGREATVRLNVLSKDLARGLDLLFAALRQPRFQEDRLELARAQALQGLEHRNDSTAEVEQREWTRLVRGADHFEARLPTRDSVRALTRDDLTSFHAKRWHPAGLLVAVSGDVATADVLGDLERRFAGWALGEPAPPPPAPEAATPVGVRLVNKPDVNQTRVTMGHLAPAWNAPDAVAIEVMNDILGGGGFTSRIMSRVRSDEGLAYQAASMAELGRTHSGTFRAVFQSKNRSVARAVGIVVEEMKRMQSDPVTPAELAAARANLVDSFPTRFGSSRRTAEQFLADELAGRPLDWWQTWRGKVQALTPADIQAAARAHLHPDALLVLAVGRIDEVVAGDPDHPEVDLKSLAGAAGLVEIPLPDPSTLARPVAERPWPGR